MNRQLAYIIIVLVILVIIVAHVFACERNSVDTTDAAKDAMEGKVGGEIYTHELLPAGKGPHSHLAALSVRGDGTSTTNMAHNHDVKEYKVGPGPDGHVHDITQYITQN